MASSIFFIWFVDVNKMRFGTSLLPSMSDKRIEVPSCEFFYSLSFLSGTKPSTSSIAKQQIKWGESLALLHKSLTILLDCPTKDLLKSAEDKPF